MSLAKALASSYGSILDTEDTLHSSFRECDGNPTMVGQVRRVSAP